MAILVVIAKHYGVYHWPWAADSFLGLIVGRIFPELHAPDLFLVLTGFLLGGHLLSTLHSPAYYATFYRKRVCRTFPLYYALLLAYIGAVFARDVVAEALWLDVGWPFETPWSLPAYALFLQSFWIAAHGYLGPHWLGITWTLAVQEQFYLVLPWLLHCAPRHRVAAVLAGLFLLAPVCRLIVVCALPAEEWYGYDCLLCCRSDALSIGVLAACVLQSEPARRQFRGMGHCLYFTATSLFIGFSIVAGAGYDGRTPAVFVLGHSYRALMYLVVVLIAVFASDGLLGGVLRAAGIRHLGRISYGLYLFHQMIRDLFFRAIYGMPVLPEGWERWVAVLEAFLLTVAFAELSWRYIEQPLIAWSASRTGWPAGDGVTERETRSQAYATPATYNVPPRVSAMEGKSS